MPFGSFDRLSTRRFEAFLGTGSSRFGAVLLSRQGAVVLRHVDESVPGNSASGMRSFGCRCLFATGSTEVGTAVTRRADHWGLRCTVVSTLGRIADGTFSVLSRALPAGERPWRTPHGIVYLDATEAWTIAARILGAYERLKLNIIRRELPVGGTFVDVGANRGDFSLVAANAVGPTGRVVAVEPATSNVESIRRTMKANRASQVEVVHAALSDRVGKATLTMAPKSGWHTLVPSGRFEPAGTEQVRLETLDRLVPGGVDMVKIDVEGAELDVLRGAVDTLRTYRPTVLMDVDKSGSADEYKAMLQATGYRVEFPGWKHLVARPV